MAKIKIPGTDSWYDHEEYVQQQEFFKQKEKEYWEYHFSGQRTVDTFGIEGARIVLARQSREDNKLRFKHKTRGKL